MGQQQLASANGNHLEERRQWWETGPLVLFPNPNHCGCRTEPVGVLQAVAAAIKESFLSLDTSTFAKALEEVEKNVLSMRQMLSGDAETEPNQDHISQLVVEICKGDVLALLIHKLPTLSWEVQPSFGTIMTITDAKANRCLQISYNNKEIALSCGNMLRECIKYPTLAKCILESRSFELFFKYVELPTFDIASDALATFKDLLTKHEMIVSQDLSQHYVPFFELYEKLLTSPNYVTRRQSLKILSDFLLEPQNLQIMKRYILEVQFLHIMMALLKDTSKNIQISAFHIFKVFVANPNKPWEIIEVLIDNHEEQLMSLQNLPMSKGEDDQFEEEKDLVHQGDRRTLQSVVGRDGIGLPSSFYIYFFNFFFVLFVCVICMISVVD